LAAVSVRRALRVRKRRPAGARRSLRARLQRFLASLWRFADAALVRASRYGRHFQSRAPHADGCLDTPAPIRGKTLRTHYYFINGPRCHAIPNYCRASALLRRGRGPCVSGATGVAAV